MTHIWKIYYALRRALGIEKVPEAVDLGLSVRWGSMNVGARANYEYGCYVQWGERPNGKCRKAYCANPKYGKVDYLTTLLPKDDIAGIRLGEGWRMPSYEEWEELKSRCEWQEVVINRVINGYMVTGPSGEKILLPFTNFADCYWTSDLAEEENHAFAITMRWKTLHGEQRYYKHTIRPVYSK